MAVIFLAACRNPVTIDQDNNGTIRIRLPRIESNRAIDNSVVSQYVDVFDVLVINPNLPPTLNASFYAKTANIEAGYLEFNDIPVGSYSIIVLAGKDNGNCILLATGQIDNVIVESNKITERTITINSIDTGTITINPGSINPGEAFNVTFTGNTGLDSINIAIHFKVGDNNFSAIDYNTNYGNFSLASPTIYAPAISGEYQIKVEDSQLGIKLGQFSAGPSIYMSDGVTFHNWYWPKKDDILDFNIYIPSQTLTVLVPPGGAINIGIIWG